MSFQSSLLKIAIKLTPNILIIWVANIVLKGIGELTAFSFDLDLRTAHVQVLLLGEEQPIDVWVDGFAIISDEQSHYFILRRAQSNKPWLTNILARIIGKHWKIPVIPQVAAQMAIVFELLQEDSVEREDC
jgi:hypothetical protein